MSSSTVERYSTAAIDPTRNRRFPETIDQRCHRRETRDRGLRMRVNLISIPIHLAPRLSGRAGEFISLAS